MRLLRGAGAAGLFAAVLQELATASAAWAAPCESISTYTSPIEISTDGPIRVTEAIAYDFGGNSRHGILRRIPVVFRYDDTHDRIYPIDDVTVTMDGAGVPVDRSRDGGFEVLRIGDPDRTVTGSHRYEIGYTVRGVLNHFATHEELYWNAVGDEWDVPIAQATATVTAPAPIGQVECFAGPTGSRLGCAQKSVQDATATFRSSNLGNGSGLSIVVAVPVGSVADVAPVLVERRDVSTAFRATPATVTGAVLLALAGIGAALFVAWRVGRDRRYLGLLPGLVPGKGETAPERRKGLLGAPPVSVEFGPPDGIRPGQVGTLVDERANVLDVTATIVDLAVRRHLRIRELTAGTRPDWELEKLTDGDPNFLGYESTLFHALFRKRDKVRLSQLRYTFARDLAKVRGQLYSDMVSQGWYRQSPATTRAVARTAAVGLVLASIAVTVVLAFTTHAALLGVGLTVGAVALLAVAGSFPARTGRGSAVLERVRGFRLYIATAEAEQIRFLEKRDVFSEFLPYAVVFGLTSRWAKVFASIGEVAPDDLYWYTGRSGFTMDQFGRSIGAFTVATSGVIATAPASSPSASGSSGFSGGGFSGGGAGGGGGGSW
jgi:hypothetical protein